MIASRCIHFINDVFLLDEEFAVGCPYNIGGRRTGADSDGLSGILGIVSLGLQRSQALRLDCDNGLAICRKTNAHVIVGVIGDHLQNALGIGNHPDLVTAQTCREIRIHH